MVLEIGGTRATLLWEHNGRPDNRSAMLEFKPNGQVAFGPMGANSWAREV